MLWTLVVKVKWRTESTFARGCRLPWGGSMARNGVDRSGRGCENTWASSFGCLHHHC